MGARSRTRGGAAARVTVAVLLVVLAVALALDRGWLSSGGSPARPNILVIQLDDQVSSDLTATYRHGGRSQPVLPSIRRLLIQEGVAFSRYYVSVPLCCPSRSALLTGRYARNNGVLSNGGRHGGFPAFRRNDYHDNLAVWLRRAGYWTVHVGKFLNGYGPKRPTVPPGWSNWQTLATDPSTSLFYGYQVNANGRLSHRYGDPTYHHPDPARCRASTSRRCKYLTDVLTRIALRTLNHSPAGKPFYLQLDYTAPHSDRDTNIGAEPPPRYAGSLASVKAPRIPSFNESDMSGKPFFLSELPLLSPDQIREIDHTNERRLESERAVDDGVRLLIKRLARLGKLDNTYVVLISDNGFFLGEHRVVSGKFLPYEPSTKMPLIIRGPGIPPGRVSHQLAANIDLAPTFLQIAHARASRPVDGSSLLGFATDPAHSVQRALLLESFTRGAPVGRARDPGAAPPVAFEAIRVGPYKYVRYGAGPTELYDLARDPFELRSLASDPSYGNVVRWLSAHLRRLIHCKAAGCREPPGPIPKPASSAAQDGAQVP